MKLRKKTRASKAAKVVKRAKPSKRPRARGIAKRAVRAERRDIEKDREAILAVSRKWWDANRNFSIAMMCEAFVGGDKFHGFNLNGHTYYAIDEWVQLWKYLGHVMTPLAQRDAGEPAMAEPRDVRLVIRGDMAFLTAESIFTVQVLPSSDSESALLSSPGSVMRIPFRATEVFVREDHEGNPVWKMWHFHCSPNAPEGERRMGF
ncbi:MAG TPA: nuclear transport factor 2 family protein [Sporolactobacillaceae bacterium]|nr:nuclear transport factor 2 family protein [Sporolactobacillaceae bacterium]